MSNLYSNIPPNNEAKDATVQLFDNYYISPLELDASTYTAMKGFFTNKGFDEVAADSIAVIIIKQSKKDGYNPLQILDTLKGLDSVEISSLVAEILNFNRLKTSYLGYARDVRPNYEVIRNILA